MGPGHGSRADALAVDRSRPRRANAVATTTASALMSWRPGRPGLAARRSGQCLRIEARVGRNALHCLASRSVGRRPAASAEADTDPPTGPLPHPHRSPTCRPHRHDPVQTVGGFTVACARSRPQARAAVLRRSRPTAAILGRRHRCRLVELSPGIVAGNRSLSPHRGR